MHCWEKCREQHTTSLRNYFDTFCSLKKSVLHWHWVYYAPFKVTERSWMSSLANMLSDQNGLIFKHARVAWGYRETLHSVVQNKSKGMDEKKSICENKKKGIKIGMWKRWIDPSFFLVHFASFLHLALPFSFSTFLFPFVFFFLSLFIHYLLIFITQRKRRCTLDYCKASAALHFSSLSNNYSFKKQGACRGVKNINNFFN